MSLKNIAAFSFVLPAICMIILLQALLPYPPQKTAQAAVMCHLQVPPDPLSERGLRTPWKLRTPCHESNPADSVFVQAVILDPFGKLATYSPLVIDSGTTPAAPPVPLQLLPGSVVGIFGGGNDDLTMLDNNEGACVNGAGGKQFGQVFFCGTARLFHAIQEEGIRIPDLGVDRFGVRCPSVRSFALVDQDQSDNVQTTYLASATGSTAQDTKADRRTLGGQLRLINGSDNTLLFYVDQAIGCTPWRIPDLADSGNLVPTQATDELQAAAYQDEPVALVPAGDPMVGPVNLELLNAYRVSVDQPPVNALGEASTRAYCAHLEHTQLAWINTHRAALITTIFPVSGTDLYQFMLQRYRASLQILGCPSTTE